jgi:hypothetical protein
MIEARVTQPFAIQRYAFSLKIDWVIQPGSDDQPTPSQSWMISLSWVLLIGAVVFVALLWLLPFR